MKIAIAVADLEYTINIELIYHLDKQLSIFYRLS